MPDSLNAVVVEAPGPHRASVIWLHGLGANGHDFEPVVPELGLPGGHGIRFVFPHAPEQPVTVNGGMVMPAWYDVREMNLRTDEDEAGIRQSVELVESYIAREISCGVDASNIVIAGFSQGGAIALHCGLRYAETLAGILALSTYLPLPALVPEESSSANASTAIFMGHGISDPVIPMVQGQQSYELLRELGYPVSWHTYPIPHAVCLEEIRDIGQWLTQSLVK